jgi:hypothetical protein
MGFLAIGLLAIGLLEIGLLAIDHDLRCGRIVC